MKRNRLLFLLVLLMTAAGGAWAQTVTYPKYLVIDVATGNHRYTDDGPDLTNDLCRKGELWLRYIPAGTFLMGSATTEPGYNGCENQHWVKLTQPFYIGVFECTQYQWKAIMSQQWSETTNPSTRPSWFNNESYWETRPVERVSYEMIRGGSKGMGWPDNDDVDDDSFMDILRTKTGMKFDLPTEAQWEYACRAGTTTALNSGTDLTKADKDDAMNAVGRYRYNSGYIDYCEDDPAISVWDLSQGTAKVGTYAPNAWNLYDMHGNVLEWCLDWNYSNSFDDSSTEQNPVEDPKGESYDSELGDSRAMRGGDWCSPASGCRSAYRGATQYDAAEAYSGFRIVCLTMPDPEQQHTYSVTMKSGTKDAEHWTISDGTTTKTGTEGLDAMAEGDAVTLKYNGRLKVKSVTATTDANPLTVPLTVEAVTDGTIKVNISNGSGTLSTGMKFSVDGGDKNLITTTTDIPVQAGQKVQFYGNEDKTQVYGGYPFVWIQGFGQGFKCNVYGNIMSLLDEEGYATMTDLPDKSDIFASLFYGNSALVDASGLLLPAKTMKNDCYNSMFYYCNNLTAAPDLPATTLAFDCYNGMFEGCNLLSVAPDLPATTLAESCYEAMFSNCFSLTAPPVLPAKALVNKCYNHMFFECWKITSITCLATSDTSEANNTDGWLMDAGKDAFGPKTFTADPSATWPLDISGIPEGWTRLNPDGTTYNP
jgi:formylglycine-generating enzyme required for sulfatase activity